MNPKIMPWVDHLPDVGATSFQARRDQVADLVKQAQQLEGIAANLKSKAYYRALLLEGDAKGQWSLETVEAAKRQTSR